jgi:hypothetical protein
MHSPRLSRLGAACRFLFPVFMRVPAVAPAALAATLRFPALRCSGIVGARIAASR